MVYRRAVEVGDGLNDGLSARLNAAGIDGGNGAIEIVAVNGTADVETLMHLLRYDSIHGTWKFPITRIEDGFRVANQTTRCFSTRNPAELPWGELDVDVVIEATGAFRTRDTAQIHLNQGAKKVVITAPAKTAADADLTVVMGVNEHLYRPASHDIVSAASCTTNCLGPVVKTLHEAFGVEHGMVTTIHSYTNDQLNLDNPHKDLRRARACTESIIPTSTGAAKAIGLVLPELKGKLGGVSVRVPTPNVSLIDLVVELQSDVTAQLVNQVLSQSAAGPLRGILGYTDVPLVSIDFNGDDRSAIVDGLSTMVLGDRTAKVLAWYDNEWGYSCRVVDLAQHMGAAVTGAETSVDKLDDFVLVPDHLSR